MSTLAVVGAGIAGLVVTHRLGATCDVVVFEREAFPGGRIRTQALDAYHFDWGPNGFLPSDDLRALARELELDAELVEASPTASKRWIYWNRKLRPVPTSPPQVLRTSLLSPFAKVRAALEPFVADNESLGEESVFAFAARRFGYDVAARIVAPALQGVSAGDAASTSLDALFPRMREFEREHGSVVRGMLHSGRKPGRLTTFAPGGMQTLTDRLAERARATIRYESTVERVEAFEGGWRLTHSGGTTAADDVVIAAPAGVAAALVERFDSELARDLREIPYAPMRVVGIAFRRSEVKAALDGFGFLAARCQGVRILGAIYTSSIFPQQAPPDTVYLRVFLGGAVDPTAIDLSAEGLRATVEADLAAVLKIRAAPIAYHEISLRRAIPQYHLGHRALVGRIEEKLGAHRGLHLTGNAYRGVGVADTIRDALAVAARVER